jgi:hypothetical protein
VDRSHERKRSGHHFYRFQHRRFERCSLRIFLDQVRDDFGVSLGEEFVAFGDELVLQL